MQKQRRLKLSRSKGSGKKQRKNVWFQFSFYEGSELDNSKNIFELFKQN